MIKEEKLEPIARYFRFRQGLKEIRKDKEIILVDLGCGPSAYFYQFAFSNNIPIKQYIGIDPLLKIKSIASNESKIILIRKDISEKLPLETNSTDYLVAFAFLEHIENPEKIIAESLRVLKRNGKAIFTLPTKKAKKILDLLSFKLSLISRREIEEHKNYFNKENLISLVPKKHKNIKISHKYFELGLNNLFILEKLQ